jgi:hypothetical protein
LTAFVVYRLRLLKSLSGSIEAQNKPRDTFGPRTG